MVFLLDYLSYTCIGGYNFWPGVVGGVGKYFLLGGGGGKGWGGLLNGKLGRGLFFFTIFSIV